MTAPAIRAGAWDDVRASVADLGANALLVSAPASVRYLSGFTSPADGKVVVLEDRAVLVTDGRYTAQAEQESRIEVRIAQPWHAAVADLVGRARLAIEADDLTVSDFGELSASLGTAPLETTGILRRVRAVKSAEEIAALRKAATVTDRAYEAAIEMIRPGVRETDVAWRIATVCREFSTSPSFDIVVASGHRSAMPHGVASDKELAEGELITIDLGAVWRGYHADMTRTVALGTPSDAAIDLYDAVLAAQEVGIAGVRAGAGGRELDARARAALSARGYGDAFTHSLGHGVGLQVHEGPSLSRRSDDVLAAGMAVTIEPGAYLPGVHGVRIEDLVVVEPGGCEVLSQSPKTLTRIPTDTR